MRCLKWLTVALAVAGVAALVLASRASARPLTLIASVSPAMNYAYVQVAGVVTSYPTLDIEGGYLSFRIQDASGDLPVSAYRSTVQSLLSARRIPMPGHVVTLEGTLRIRDEAPALIMNTAQALQLSVPEPTALALSAIEAVPLGARVTAGGQVRRARDVGGRLRIITIRQNSAEVDVLLPIGLAGVFGDSPSPQVGDWLTVTGGVGEYRGARQLQPALAQDVAVSPMTLQDMAGRLDIRPISALNRALIGEWVAVRGSVTDVQPIEPGALIGLQGADGRKTTVVIFDAWFSIPFSQTLRARDSVIVQGELVDYKGKLEIQPELPIDFLKDEG